MPRKAIDLSGRTFHRWTVIERVYNGRKEPYYHCKCECGTEKDIRGSSLIQVQSKSCGCYNSDEARERMTTHGSSLTSEFNIWSAIRKRCLKEYCTEYKRYGEKGITICERWKDSFENFYNDMGPRPSKDHSIDRINNEKGYSPENCRWATRTEQQRNKGTPKNNTSGGKGIQRCKDKWHAMIYISSKRIFLGSFISFEEAKTARQEAELKYWGKSS